VPTRARRICPRCGNAYTKRCSVCARRLLRKTKLRAEANGPNPYASSEWRAFSRAFLAVHLTCECERHMSMPEWKRPRSQVTDHIDGLGPLGPNGYDPSNCQALTIRCHGHKTATMDGGFGRPRAAR
jgi:hypothetical protein